ncbi:MAG: XdhC family protein [Bacillota bacterium]|jgi:xanthine dehydrogenase accessory factor
MRELWRKVSDSLAEGIPVSLNTAICGPRAGACGLYSLDGHFLAGVDLGFAPGRGLREDLFADILHPRPCLVIFGGGHVAVPVAELGKLVDFEVIVNDDRPEFANPQRFPHADKILVKEHGQALAQLNPGPRHYLVIVTRGHVHDRECLIRALATEASYIGVIGSIKKATEMKQWLLEQGYGKEDVGRVFSPIGLDIKAVTPEEIAVSIMAEIIRERNRRPPSANIGAITAAIEDKPPGETWALATIVESSGSTPRGPGARMLITPRGTIGSVGGGACEKEAEAKAQEVMETGKPCLLEFHLDNNIAAQEGGVCGGSMRIFLQAI